MAALAKTTSGSISIKRSSMAAYQSINQRKAESSA